MMDSMESQQTLSGTLSTVRLKQIQKDRQRRTAEQKRQNKDHSPNSNSSHSPHSEPIFSPEDTEADISLRKELEETFVKTIPYPHKNRKTAVTEQGMRINVTI